MCYIDSAIMSLQFLAMMVLTERIFSSEMCVLGNNVFTSVFLQGCVVDLVGGTGSVVSR